MGHDHGHGVALSAGGQHKGRLALALGITLSVFIVELVGGLLTGSLALLADAAHMGTDVLGLGMALAAIHVAGRAFRGTGRTFGMFRVEILAALANSVLVLGVALFVLYEAISRLSDPPSLASGEILIIGIVGLAANLVAFVLLRPGAKESLNLRGAYLEVFADMLGSIGVILAAIIMATTGWNYADPIVAGAIGVFLIPRALRLGAASIRVLLQAAPAAISPQELKQELATLDHVVDVHDVHVWTLTSGMEVASAHVMVNKGCDSHAVLDQALVHLDEAYGLTHVTLQIEPEDHEGCDDVNW